jgi:hypothetical protein
MLDDIDESYLNKPVKLGSCHVIFRQFSPHKQFALLFRQVSTVTVSVRVILVWF